MSREEVERNQRERLMDAFVQLVAEQGYAAAGIKTTCQRAGVSYNAFYELFGTKDALFLATYDVGVAALFDAARDAVEADGLSDWEARIEAGLRFFLRILAENPLFARFFTVEVTKAGLAAQARVDDMFEAAFALVARPDLRPDDHLADEHLGPLVVGGIYTRLYFYIRTGRTAQLEELLPVLTRFVRLNSVGRRTGQ